MSASRLPLRIALFMASLFVWAGLAWLGGYNFDHRSQDVAVAAFCAIAFSLLAASAPMSERRR